MLSPERSKFVTDGSADRTDVEGVAEALANRRRQFVLYFLSEHDDVTVSELADVVAGWTAVVESRTATRTERAAAHEALVDRDLPAMAESGYLEYDPDAGTVSLPDPTDRSVPGDRPNEES